MSNDDDVKAIVSSDELRSTLDKVTEAAYNQLRFQYNIVDDPYDKYCMHIQLQLFKDLSDYQKRCLEGYLSLLDVLHD